MTTERCPDCAPVHKLTIYRANWQLMAGFFPWYVSCQVGECNDRWVPKRDGFHGRRTWAEAFALGVAHQEAMKEEPA